jgi:hypothetical protein
MGGLMNTQPFRVPVACARVGDCHQVSTYHYVVRDLPIVFTLGMVSLIR